IYTTSTQTGGAATSTNTGNAPDSDVPATGLTDDDFNRVSVSTIVINAPTGTRSSLATQVISGTSNLPTGTTFTVTGTLSGGGTQTCTATVSAGGAWTCPATAFRDGSWSLTASATDGVDTTPTSAAFAMTVSAPSAPSLTAPANGALVSSATVALSGTSTEATGTTIQAFAVSGGTTKSCTATVTAGGTWTCNVTSLPDGTYTETAQVVEASGTLGPAAASRTFYANSAGFVSPVINQNAPALVATSTPAITGTAPSWETGAPYSLQVKDGSTVVCTINPAITPWSCNTSTLADGAHTLTAVLLDGSGATKASTTTDNITVDTTPPAKLTVTSSSGPFKTPQAISGNGGEVGALVTVKNGATVLCTATVQSGGTWSCTPGAMSDGNYSLTIFETDAAGNNSPTTAFNYIIDATPPSVTITATSPTNNNKPPLSGTASAAVSGVTVSVTVRDENNNTVCTPTVTSGNWSCTPGSAYADGTHTFTATATDGAGNTNTANKAVTIDATPPAITLTQPQYATTSTPLLTGTSEAGASVVVKDQNGTTMCSVASVPASGNWSCVSAARVDGTYTVTATATDSLNNSASTSKQLIIDTVAPGKLTVTSSSGPFKTPAPISGNGGEVGDAVFVKDSNGNVICQGTVQTGGTWSCTPGALADGNYTYQVTQVDPAGNVSQATSFNYIIDSQPPTVSISVTSPTANNKPALSGNAAATVTGVSVNVVVKDENGNTLCSATASGGTWSCTPTTAIADGAHTLTATATDGAGNTATASTGLTVDTTPPALTLVAGPYATTSTPVFSGTSEAGAKVVVKDQNGNTLCAVNSVPASGNWSCTSSALVDGAYTITATATDALNNAATASKPLTVDTVPPAVALTTAALTNSKNPAITGTAEVGASVVVKDENGNTLCSIASVPAGGAWSCPASAAALSDGAHTLTATATDAAGNTATSSKSMTVDTQAPAVALTTAALVSTHTPAISGAAEVGASVVVKDENGNVLCTVASVGSNGTFSCPVSASALADGAHTLTATATDAAGNTGTASKTMTVDTTAPAVALTTPAAINSTTPAISGTSEAGASVVVKDESGNVVCAIASVPAGGAWSCPASASPLPEGNHTLTATATDPAGNLGVANKSITIDLTPPAKPTVTGPTAPVNDPSTPITGTGEPGATVSITDKDGAVVCTATVQGDGTWSCTPTSPLPEGDDTLTVVQTDPAGNRSAATDFTVTIDTSAPAITLAAVALQDTNLPVFSGTAEP
ncbi:MAG: Ig-like domain repeat protein, partial [Deltaproteobacteria bacterium]|nr:Ig-like domain repeat protein [Deltaproteobacteria bacterium]